MRRSRGDGLLRSSRRRAFDVPPGPLSSKRRRGWTMTDVVNRAAHRREQCPLLPTRPPWPRSLGDGLLRSSRRRVFGATGRGLSSMRRRGSPSNDTFRRREQRPRSATRASRPPSGERGRIIATRGEFLEPADAPAAHSAHALTPPSCRRTVGRLQPPLRLRLGERGSPSCGFRGLLMHLSGIFRTVHL